MLDLVSDATMLWALSGGLRRRLDITRAMLHEPRFLLMDEPTTGLDLESFEQTWRLLEELRSTVQTAILLTTHRPDEARDATVWSSCGRVMCAHATPEQLLEEAGNDLLILETRFPDLVTNTLSEELSLPAAPIRTTEGHLAIQVARAQEWVVPIAGLFDTETLQAISVRRPGLAEAYLKVTGANLSAHREETAVSSTQRFRKGDG